MARRRTKKHTKRKRGGDRKRGGGFTFPGGSISPGNLIVRANPQSGGPDCLAQSRPGEQSLFSLQQARQGLPGMSGGRYTTDLSQSLIGSSRPDVTPFPCERSIPNSLNLRGGSRMVPLSVPTAGYTTQVSSAGGVPLLLNVPQNGRSCVTGGSRRKRHRRSHRRRIHRVSYRRRR